MSTSDREKIEKHRIALFFAHKERYIDRGAREAFTNALHDILKHRKMLGLTYRKDGCVSVRELVGDSILASKIYTHSNNVYLVELPTFSNVILHQSPKAGERGSIA